MSKHEDRAYQQEIEDAVIDYLFSEPGNPVVASPGGTGKSFVMAKLVKRFHQEWPGTRIMLLAQDAKLLDQNSEELYRLWPTAPIGIYSAGLKMRDTNPDIIFGGIQSVAKRAEEFGLRHIVIVDECDQISPAGETQYQRFIGDLKKLNPDLRVIGFTATPYRLGMGCLTNLDLWDRVVIDLTKTERFNWFVDHGYLAPLITKKTVKEIDVQNVSIKGGEFDAHDLQEAADTDDLNRAVVEECVRYGRDRKHWLVFSSGVDHGHKLAKLFNARGVPALMLTGKDTMKEREEGEEAFRKGEIRCLINCGLYGRGWNFPALDMIAWVRATQSTALWVQGTVRGTRTAPGKKNCLVLDFAGNIRRLGPINDPITPKPRRKGDKVEGEAPMKECPQCFSYVHTTCRTCPDCGYEFPPPSTIEKTASEDEIIRKHTGIPEIEEFEVLGIRYKAGVSKKGNEYFQITYSVGTANFKEALFFDSQYSGTVRRARVWWEFRGGKQPIPTSAEEAAERAPYELATPHIIRVDVAEKYPKVIGCDFESDDRDTPANRGEPVYDEDSIPF